MNVIIIDTSSWISYFSNKSDHEKEIDVALQEGRVYVPPLVVAELMSANLSTDLKENLTEFLRELPLCDTSLEHWFRVGELRSFLMSQKLKVSTPDAHIAQSVLDLEGYLLSEDRVFREISKYKDLRHINK